MPLRALSKQARSAPLPGSRQGGAQGAQGVDGSARPPGAAALDCAVIGLACRVVAVAELAGAPDWVRWLGDIGFMPGERVTVTARSAWGGDRLVVRIGQSTFALRRAEAACVLVEPA